MSEVKKNPARLAAMRLWAKDIIRSNEIDAAEKIIGEEMGGAETKISETPGQRIARWYLEVDTLTDTDDMLVERIDEAIAAAVKFNLAKVRASVFPGNAIDNVLQIIDELMRAAK